MRTLLIIAIAAFAFQPFGEASAQYKVGIKAGGGSGTLGASPSLFDVQPGAAYHAGIFAQVTRYQSRFFVRPELLFSSRNYQFKTNLTKEQASFQYLSIPIMFGYKASNKLNILTGIEPAFLVSSSMPPMLATDKSLDVLINLGVAYDITYNMGLELRAGQGLLSLFDAEWTDANGQVTTERAGFTQVLQLSLSYNFAREGKSDTKPVLR